MNHDWTISLVGAIIKQAIFEFNTYKDLREGKSRVNTPRHITRITNEGRSAIRFLFDPQKKHSKPYNTLSGMLEYFHLDLDLSYIRKQIKEGGKYDLSKI